MKNYIIKELILDDENEQSGIQAVSLVDFPAIEEDFMYFSKDNKDVKVDLLTVTESGVPIRDFYEYTAQPEPEIIEDSHKFCREKAGHVYHISEINSWGRLNAGTQKEYGFNTESNFFATFNGNIGSFNVNQQIYNCRHWFRRVNSANEIPLYKRKMNFSKQHKDNLQVDFSISNKEKREIEGLVLQSGQFIYRNDIEGQEGYVFFSRDTIRKLKEKFGYNRSMTIQHSDDITGTAILLDSWLDEDEENNKTKWFVRYKIIDDKLWQVIKSGEVRGFSVEAFLTLIK